MFMLLGYKKFLVNHSLSCNIHSSATKFYMSYLSKHAQQAIIANHTLQLILRFDPNSYLKYRCSIR